jgi:general secretion pathway protein J
MAWITNQNIKGFTLLEVLLAVAIFAMISLASFSIFDGVLKSDAHSQRYSERLNQVQRAWLFIERDFLQLARRSMRIEGEAPLSGFVHNDVELLSSSDQSIAFVRQGWTNPGLLIPRSDLQSVAYRLNDNNLERLHFNFVDSVVGEQPKERVLIHGITALSFEYYYAKDWQQELQDNQLPLAIRVNITSEELGELHRQFLVSGDLNSSPKARR